MAEAENECREMVLYRPLKLTLYKSPTSYTANEFQSRESASANARSLALDASFRLLVSRQRTIIRARDERLQEYLSTIRPDRAFGDGEGAETAWAAHRSCPSIAGQVVMEQEPRNCGKQISCLARTNTRFPFRKYQYGVMDKQQNIQVLPRDAKFASVEGLRNWFGPTSRKKKYNGEEALEKVGNSDRGDAKEQLHFGGGPTCRTQARPEPGHKPDVLGSCSECAMLQEPRSLAAISGYAIVMARGILRHLSSPFALFHFGVGYAPRCSLVRPSCQGKRLGGCRMRAFSDENSREAPTMNRGGRLRANTVESVLDVSFGADGETVAADRGVYFSADGR
ncbi:hypothetical protein B0H16DRAFT_1701643 [Mycena metata]|uniref:Uncharacterized protein n=1 Tax=Mycena metata TaxID=1033252 RepID=A0AAD7HA73_9AGAR|nr:hypothetical protein B0H16DRAFT_1701643 [Mycena metata]